MLEHLKNQLNQTRTENGANAYKSTQSAVLDLFSQGGAMRGRSNVDIEDLVWNAFVEDKELTLKTLFYLRDVRGGQGERNLFRVAIRTLAYANPDAIRKNLEYIPNYGRWDDLLALLETPLKTDVVQMIRTQLVADKATENPSLLAKWMPSANASSKETKRKARQMIKLLNCTPRQYRKLLSLLRKKIDILETKITKGEYSKIDYSHTPSRAGMIYKNAFLRNDGIRYDQFLNDLSDGKVTVNAGVLYPNEIIKDLLDASYGYANMDKHIKLATGQWNNLPDFIGDKVENSLVMADVSESMNCMNGTPMQVSIALAMYIAERNKGAYHNHFMTFTDRPSIVEIKGDNIFEKVKSVKSRKGYSTNIEKAIRVILDTAIDNRLSDDDIVKKLYIISDMQFDDYSIKGTSKTVLEELKHEFEEAGYSFPEIVYWNVNSFSNSQATKDERGVQMVSGYSPSIMKDLLGSVGRTPYEFMLEVLSNERYSVISA